MAEWIHLDRAHIVDVPEGDPDPTPAVDWMPVERFYRTEYQAGRLATALVRRQMAFEQEVSKALERLAEIRADDTKQLNKNFDNVREMIGKLGGRR